MPFLFQTGIVVFLLALGFLIGGFRERSHFRSIARREAEFQDIGIANLRAVTDPQSVEFARLVVADCVIATDYFKGFLSAIRNILGGEMRSYESLMERARREAVLRLLDRARQMGATELWNLRLETSNVMSGSQQRTPAVAVEVTASATAIKRRG